MTTNKLPQTIDFNPNNGKGKKILISMLIIAVLVLGCYLCYDKRIKPYIQQRELAAYNLGQLSLYNQFIQELSQCKQVPLKIDNETTVNAVLVECLQGAK